MPNPKYNYVTKRFRDNTGKVHWVYGKTEEEAIIKREKKKAALAAGNPVRDSSMQFKVWADVALDTYKPNVSAQYLYQMKNRLKIHILPVIGYMPLSRITLIECQQILNGASNLSKSTITKLSQELHFYFAKAIDSGLLVKNPAEKVIRPKGYTNKRRSLTAEERAAFLKIAPTDRRFFLFELMLYCGCRPMEAAEVRYEDVTEIEGIPFLHIRGTKTANSDRFVPIPEELQGRLSGTALRGLCATTSRKKHHNGTTYKRLRERLRREMDIALGAEVYRNQIVTSVLADDFVPYLFRHTYCTDLKKKGVDVRIAKDLMGHADIKTTANIYDHADGDTLLLAARQMGIYGKECSKNVANA